jgi:tetratricopeptide (TPR) repeat protein
LDPGSAEAHNNWGGMLLAHSRISEAMDHFRKAIEINPDYAEVQINLGTALAEQNQAAEAIGHYERALEIKPGNGKAHYNLANILATQGRFDEAIRHYGQAVALMPDFIHARYQLAVLLESRGEFAAAIAQFQKILDLDPRHAPAQNNLAWLLATCPDASLRNGNKALELAESAQQIGGNHPEILDTLAAAYAETGEYGKAAETAKLALNLFTNQTDHALSDAIRNRLDLYQLKMPFRETAPAFKK